MSKGDLKSSFEERGYVGPVRLFDKSECRRILARLHSDDIPPLDWGKGRAATSIAYYSLATDDRILDLVTSLIGDDVLLWGAQSVVRRAGQEHHWHTDVESAAPSGQTVTVWIGLSGTNARTSLKVVPYSHRFGVTLQEAAQGNGGVATDDDVARLARERERRSSVALAETVDGEALIFDGRLWHGSHNVGRETREAVLLQYATPATAVRMPVPGRFEWPFEFQEVPKPPCIVVSGRDTAVRNRVVPGPSHRSVRVQPALRSRIHALELPLDQDAEVGWKPHPLFRGSTADIQELKAHVSILDPGREPHPPHSHDDEEILVVLDGEPTLVLGDAGSTRRAARGAFAYYPAGFAHTIRNESEAPTTYAMFKWTTDRKEQGRFLDHRVFSPGDTEGDARRRSEGVVQQPLLDGETKYLRKLHAHRTTLQPGAGYEPHVDSYDVAIVVLEGTVETLGERVGPNTVIFYAAGEPHGMRNVGDAPAVYLVFEFRGRHSKIGRPPDRRLRRRFLAAARHPRAAARTLSERLRIA
jgi:quercetin dioxygenase-like cupin family protein